jgi:hypothetical protein
MMRSLLLAVALFTGVIGCDRGPESTAGSTMSTPTTEAVISTPSKLTLDRSQRAICKSGWTCDDVHFFTTQAACNTSCGGGCFRDFNCNGTCVCP